jgi:predicted Zn-ribbon and HTH transcriptional regulator
MTVPKAPAPTPERATPVRAAIREALLGRPLSAHEISQRASLSEKDVAAHLEHLQRSLRARGERLVVKPATCLACGYVFRERARLKDPGSCPECQSAHIGSATFRIEAAPGGERKSRPTMPRRAEDDAGDDDTEG